MSTARVEALRFDGTSLQRALAQLLAPVEGRQSGWCVALSGGLDSTALIAALAEMGRHPDSPPIRAIHVDHGLHADSAQWARACAEVATSAGIPCEQLVIRVRACAGESPEAAARNARYAAIAGRLKPAEVLLTAHHADDQLETVLLQWLRGGGLRAVAGMQPLQTFGSGWIARPLLQFTRGEIQAYAVARDLQWQEDPSNLDSAFDRNYLRLEVLPRIRARWPAAARTVARVGTYAREALQQEAERAQADLAFAAVGSSLSLVRLGELPEVRQRALLRAWLRALGLAVPATTTLAALRKDMLRAGEDRVPCSRWPGVAVRRYRGLLFAEPTDGDHGPAVRAGEWDVRSAPYRLDAVAVLRLEPAVGVGLSRDRLPDRLQVRARAGGDVFSRPHTGHRTELRKFLQDQGILPWRRYSIPLLLANDEVVAVGDLAVGTRWAARPGEASFRVIWHPRPLLCAADFTSRPIPSPSDTV